MKTQTNYSRRVFTALTLMTCSFIMVSCNDGETAVKDTTIAPTKPNFFSTVMSEFLEWPLCRCYRNTQRLLLSESHSSLLRL